MRNTNLKTAKKSKNDEFYTLMEDIEKELRFYTESFEGKIVYCNCDNYQQSNFYKYFYYNFHYLKLKKLICTCFNADDNGLYAIYDGEIETTGKLNGDGDFRSEECIEYLKECDVVVTNPPFSLFREYVKQLMDYGKKFIIIGEQNALTYKEIFPLIKDNKIWWGKSIHSGDRKFYVPDNYPLNASTCGIDENGKRFVNVKGIRWWTNVKEVINNEPLNLYKRYSFEDYPKYENFDAINVDKVADIPMDYDGIMGVPITFLDKYCPTQFEIIGLMSGAKDSSLINGNDGRAKFYINGKGVYARILIRKIMK